MGTAVAEQIKKAKKRKGKKIPDYLIYEVVKGRPVYYKGYKDVLNGTKTFEEITMESILQSWLKAQITGILFVFFKDKDYEIATGELGLNLSGKNKRGADIAIYKTENPIEINEFFASTPPEIIIEIDVRADTENQSEMDYVHEKIEDYLDFGVKKVIWLFSKTKKVMIADGKAPWLTYGWDKVIKWRSWMRSVLTLINCWKIGRLSKFCLLH